MRLFVAQAWALTRLQWAAEGNALGQLALDALIFPLSIAYLAFCIVPPIEGLRIWVLTASVVLSMGAVMNRLGLNLLNDRFSGRLDLFRVQAFPRSAYVLAHMIPVVVYAMVILAGGTSIALISGLASLPDNEVDLALLALAALVAALGMAALGALVAVRCTSYMSGAAALSVIGLLLTFGSPVYYSIELLPEPMRWLAWWSPHTMAVAAVRSLLMDTPVPGYGIAALLTATPVVMALMVRGIRWSDR